MNLSIVIATIRDSFGGIEFYENQHLFARTWASLKACYEEWPHFEVVIADSRKHRNLQNELRMLGPVGFKFRSVPVDNYWLRNRFWNCNNAFNTGAIHADGDVFLFLPDCTIHPVGVFPLIEHYCNHGQYPNLVYALLKNGKLSKGWVHRASSGEETEWASLPEAQRSGSVSDDMYADYRWLQLSKSNGYFPPEKCYWSWYYTGNVITREDFFYINGWDENFDGVKCLPDVEMGSRLDTCGRFKMCMDARVHYYMDCHHEFDKNTVREGTYWIRNNLELIRMIRNKGIYRANDYQLTEDECWEVINSRYDRPVESYGPYSRDPATNPIYEHQCWWIKNQPRFNIKELWEKQHS